MRSAYYARPMCLYGTPEEMRDMMIMNQLGYAPIPFTDEMQRRAKVEGMGPFLEMVAQSEALFFRAFPCGKIGAGVWAEIREAEKFRIPVLELPRIDPGRELSVENTRWYLARLGER